MRKINGKGYAPFDLTNPLHKDYLRQKAWIRNHLGEEHLITGIFGGKVCSYYEEYFTRNPVKGLDVSRWRALWG